MSCIETPVGDVTSQKRGSGARANGAKPQLDLVPVRYWLRLLVEKAGIDYNHKAWYDGLVALRLWQDGDTEAIAYWLDSIFPADWLEAVAVLEYGADKYAAWNWAKGMPWKVPLGCALRHTLAHFIDGEEMDAESGGSHWGHFICNVMMLDYFRVHYPEGDDRPLFED